MGWLRRLLGREEPEEDEGDDDAPEKLHCIRFMTERGEQVAVLLTSEEFERGLTRWVQTVDTMPIEMVDQEDDERMG